MSFLKKACFKNKNNHLTTSKQSQSTAIVYLRRVLFIHQQRWHPTPDPSLVQLCAMSFLKMSFLKKAGSKNK